MSEQGKLAAAVVIPIKTNNQRLPGKNTRLLGDKPLLNHLFDTVANNTTLARVFVDSSDEKILDTARWYGFTPIKRPESLNTPETSGHDLLAFEMPHIEYPIVAQLFVTLPFLSNHSITAAVRLLQDYPAIDSALPVYEIYNRFWSGGKPINHDPSTLVGTQYMRPVWCEVGFYVFRREAFLREGARVTKRRAPLKVPAEEAIDIDTETDFVFAEALYNNRQKTVL